MSDACHSFTGVSFGGVPCAQYFVDFLLWEAVLNSNSQLEGIIEIGTWQGGFSRYLYAQADARGLFFHTFDAQDPNIEPFPPGYLRLDAYRYPETVIEHCQGVPVALFCDGGNKPRELKTFPQLLPEGSIVLVHDWGTETLQSDVPDTLEELYGDYCDEIGSVTRVFKLKGEKDGQDSDGQDSAGA